MGIWKDNFFLDGELEGVDYKVVIQLIEVPTVKLEIVRDRKTYLNGKIIAGGTFNLQAWRICY